MLTRHHEIQGTRGPQRQAVWQVVALRGAVKDYVLGLVFYDDGQAEEGAAGIQRVAQMRCDRPPTTPRQRSMVESSGGSYSCSQDIPLSPLPPTVRPQVIG